MFRPKPMLPIGDRPILWHILKTYAHSGFAERWLRNPPLMKWKLKIRGEMTAEKKEAQWRAKGDGVDSRDGNFWLFITAAARARRESD